MQVFDTWDIVKDPFPHTNRPVREHRPALVIAMSGIQEQHGLLWAAMITSAENREWPEDVTISNSTRTGLPSDSVARTAKIATIEAKEAERIGILPGNDRLAARQHVLKTSAVLSQEG
jgi:mRNA interferase MazF